MIVKSADWSASSDRFKLAEAVLLDDFDTANYLVKKIGSQGDVKIFAYREWPIFREYRKTEGFLKTFEEVFNEPFYSEHVAGIDDSSKPLVVHCFFCAATTLLHAQMRLLPSNAHIRELTHNTALAQGRKVDEHKQRMSSTRNTGSSTFIVLLKKRKV